MSETDDKDYKKWIKRATIATVFLTGCLIVINGYYAYLLQKANSIKYSPYVTIMSESGKGISFSCAINKETGKLEDAEKIHEVYFWIKNIGDVFAYISGVSVYVANNTAPDDTWKSDFDLGPNEEMNVRLCPHNAASKEGELTFEIKYKRNKESSDEYTYKKRMKYENYFDKDENKWENNLKYVVSVSRLPLP